MIKKINLKLKDNSGNATFLWGVIFLFIMLAITAGIIFVMSRYAVISDLKKTAQSTLDSYVDRKSVAIYSSIKNSHDYTGSLESTEYQSDLRDNLHLNNSLECYENGDLKYRISNIKLEFIESKEKLKVRVTFRLYMPFYFASTKTSEIDTDVHIESRFNFK